jgi:hypothetical protein
VEVAAAMAALALEVVDIYTQVLSNKVFLEAQVLQ